jgi:hypothetical protein
MDLFNLFYLRHDFRCFEGLKMDLLIDIWVGLVLFCSALVILALTAYALHKIWS